jgi:hypothetical protein
LNLLPLVRFAASSAEGTVSATMSLKGTLKNLFVATACLAATATIVLYAIGENFIITPR